MYYVYFTLQCIAAYLLLDILTGLYHFATDNGWNIRKQVELFQKHHRENSMKFDILPMLGGVPVLLLGLYIQNPFVGALGFFGCFAELPHYFAHNGSSNPVVKFLQYTGAFISPDHHQGHHTGEYDRDFCVVTNWNNWWLNKVFHFFFQPTHK